MKLYVIFAQRKERYEGEYGVEALDVADEYTMDENSDWLYGKLEERKKDPDLVAVEIIEIDLGNGAQDAIREQLIGTITIKGSVVKE